MSLVIADNFKYQGRKPLDVRLVVETKAELLAVPTSTIYDGIKVYVKSEKKFYVYDSTNTADPVLDKWTEFPVGTGDIEPFDTLAYSRSLTVDLGNDETLPISDLVGTPAITDIHVGQYLNDKSGIIAKVISIDDTNNEIKVRVLTKDTIIKTDTIHYNGVLDNVMGVTSTIDYSDLDTTEPIADFSTNNLIYGDSGTLAKVLSKDITAGTLQVTPVSVDIALSTMEVYKSLKDIDKTIGKQQTLLLSELDTSKLITDIEKNQLVYDSKGVLAKIDSVFVGDGIMTQSSITITTISGSGDGTSIEAYKYIGTTTLDKISGNRTTVSFSDIDTTKAITEIQTNQLVYDAHGTLTKVVLIDIPNSQVLLQTLTTSGMTNAPVLKELVIVEHGQGYQVGDIIQSTNPLIYGEVIAVGTNGEIEQVVLSTQTTQIVNGTKAIIDYSTVIYGATGSTWTPLHNTSTQVAQIMSEPFDYQQGYVYTITNPGSGYIVGDVVSIGHNVEVTSVDTNGEILSVKYSRNEQLVHGTGASITFTPSLDIFIIPDAIWNNSKQNQFDITNDDGAYTTFNRLDTTTTKYAVGNETVYKFTFDNSNGTIIQEKTTFNASGGGIGPFIPQKNYKKDDVIINDNIIYICKDDHTADLSLGADISHWEEMRKQMTSGMRHVTASISISSITTSWTTQALTYYDGDQSMLNSNDKCLVVPQDGLYLINADSSIINTGTAGKYSALSLNNSWIGFGYAEGTVVPSVSSILYLKKDDKLEYQTYSSSPLASAGPIKLTMTLLSDDRSDNLLAEATLAFSNQEANVSKTMKFIDSSNPSIISNNGIITLPEDGHYLLSQDQSLMTTTAADHNILTRIIKGSTIIYDYQSTGAQSKYSNSYVFVLSGRKGDTFSVDNRTSIVLNNRTLANSPKIRLFKIKSVDYHIDSHDLYEDSGSTETYEDWIASKLKTEQLTVSATISLSNMIANQFKASDLTYYSGETSMLIDNKLIAPVSGLYSIEVPVMGLETHVTGIQAVTSINKNDITSTDWTGCIQANQSYGNNLTNGVSTVVWLNKDDYITIKFRCTSDNALVNTLSPGKVIMTLINSGLSTVQPYTSDKPHLWPVDTEVDLGDDLYGYRIKGNITATSNKQMSIIILESTTPRAIINSGGYWNYNDVDKANIYNVGHYLLDSSNEKRYSDIMQYLDGTNNKYKLSFISNSTSVRTNAPYDVWVTYTKEVITNG